MLLFSNDKHCLHTSQWAGRIHVLLLHLQLCKHKDSFSKTVDYVRSCDQCHCYFTDNGHSAWSWDLSQGTRIFFFFTPSRFQTVSFLSHSKISWCGHPLPDSRGDLLSSFYHLALHWQGDHSVIKSEDYSVQNARKGGGGGRGEEERGSGRRRRGGGEEGEGIGHIWRAGGKFFCKMEVWESPGGGTSWDWPWEFKFECQHRK